MAYDDDDYTSPQETYENLVSTLANRIFEDLRSHAQAMRTTPESLLHAVVAQLAGEESRADGRARDWRARVRLYDYASGLNDPVVDSNPKLPPDFDGETTIRGLKEVMKWLGETASAYHDAPCFGLEAHVLGRKIGGLRTQISNRGDDTGVIRANYHVRRGDRVRYMLARCDIARVQPKEDPPRSQAYA